MALAACFLLLGGCKATSVPVDTDTVDAVEVIATWTSETYPVFRQYVVNEEGKCEFTTLEDNVVTTSMDWEVLWFDGISETLLDSHAADLGNWDDAEDGYTILLNTEHPCGLLYYIVYSDGSSNRADTDGDGHTSWLFGGSDCDDEDSSVHPEADEICDGKDNDCDNEVDNNPTDGSVFYRDLDGDGFGDPNVVTDTESCEAPTGYKANGTDCDDNNADVHPGADEECNDRDDDCDGVEDNNAVDANIYYKDADKDGYGDDYNTEVACVPGADFVDVMGDCDDANGAINPEALEECDGEDNDCNGVTDEDTATDALEWFEDVDGDGYGNPDVSDVECNQPAGYTNDGTDCDDGNGNIHPNATEHCDGVDYDCDGLTLEDDSADATDWYADTDGDNYGDPANSTTACSQPSDYVSDYSDCDDEDEEQFPGADEYCNGEDDDCDGAVDEAGAVDELTWFEDADEDGFGLLTSTVTACDQPTGYVSDGTDCDDGNDDIHPDATELCDSKDNDCDGATDEDDAEDAADWYADTDGDGFGDPDTETKACSQPTDYVGDNTDCNDDAATAYPGADELCDEIDNDCEGDVDEDDAIDVSPWYMDADGDGFGDPDDSTEACNPPTDYVASNEDCDDNDGDVSPDALEYCDGIDNNCDDSIDEDTAEDAGTWYADADEDGFGKSADSKTACEAPDGYIEDDTDCDDTNAAVNPDAIELCDTVDNDCDGETDEDDANDAPTWYHDADSDLFGDPDDSTVKCNQPSNHVAVNTDCDDTDGNTHPGADEYCDGEDDDCDGELDEDDSVDAPTWYEDADSDGFGLTGSSYVTCYLPDGYVALDGDCDDGNDGSYPGADEYCDGEDNDCDGTTDEDTALDATTWYADTDGDGYGDPDDSDVECNQPTDYTSDSTDCDDGDATIHPNATEHCDGVDYDCDGETYDDDSVDAATWHADTDGDSYGDPTSTKTACTQPTDYVSETADNDCDDTDGAFYPGETRNVDITFNAEPELDEEDEYEAYEEFMPIGVSGVTMYGNHGIFTHSECFSAVFPDPSGLCIRGDSEFGDIAELTIELDAGITALSGIFGDYDDNDLTVAGYTSDNTEYLGSIKATGENSFHTSTKTVDFAAMGVTDDDPIVYVVLWVEVAPENMTEAWVADEMSYTESCPL